MRTHTHTLWLPLPRRTVREAWRAETQHVCRPVPRLTMLQLLGGAANTGAGAAVGAESAGGCAALGSKQGRAAGGGASAAAGTTVPLALARVQDGRGTLGCQPKRAAPTAGAAERKRHASGPTPVPTPGPVATPVPAGPPGQEDDEFVDVSDDSE